VYASSEAAAPLARALRATFPDHEVTRCDAAQDFDGPGTWDRLSGLLLGMADERGLSIDQNGDWYRGRDGRTLYVGSRRSAVFLRLYEKGKQLRAIGAPGAESVSPDLVRVELQSRPEGGSRGFAAACGPMETFGFAVWAQEAARLVFGADVARVSLKPVRDSDDERAFRAMAEQYSGVLGRLADDRGSFDALWIDLERRVRSVLARKVG
jgi:hypothetical protein